MADRHDKFERFRSTHPREVNPRRQSFTEQVLRINHFIDMKRSIGSMVLLEREMVVTVAQAIQELILEGLPSEFDVFDVFEIPKTEDLEKARDRAAQEAARRAFAFRDKENFQSVLYFYVASVAAQMSAKGVWLAPQPAPLKGIDIIVVYERLARHPAVRPGQTFATRGNDGPGWYTMKNGLITIEPKKPEIP